MYAITWQLFTTLRPQVKVLLEMPNWDQTTLFTFLTTYSYLTLHRNLQELLFIHSFGHGSTLSLMLYM